MDERLEFDELKEHASELQARIASLSQSLIPYYSRRRQLRNEIAQTHVGFWQGADFQVCGFDFDNAETRAGIFPELDRLNEIHAPIVQELNLIRRQLHGLQDRMAALQRLLAKRQ